jgi:hypothetical protein
MGLRGDSTVQAGVLPKGQSQHHGVVAEGDP